MMRFYHFHRRESCVTPTNSVVKNEAAKIFCCSDKMFKLNKQNVLAAVAKYYIAVAKWLL